MKHLTTLYLVAATLGLSGCHASRRATTAVADTSFCLTSERAAAQYLRADSLDFTTLVMADSIVWQRTDSQGNNRAVAYGISMNRRVRNTLTETSVAESRTDSVAVNATRTDRHSETIAETPFPQWLMTGMVITAGLLLLAVALRIFGKFANFAA